MTLTQTLIQGGIIKQLKMPSYFYQGIFATQFLSQSDTIIFDDVYQDMRGIAKYVLPSVVSKANRNKSFDVKAFTPAYLKEKDAIEAFSPVLQGRMAGEQIGGSMSPEQRAQAIRAYQLRMHRWKVENRIEQMCAEALKTGKLAISGDQYGNVTVDFNRDASLTVATLGAQKWNSAGVNPLDSIATYRDKAYEVGNAVIDTLIMGKGAFASFYKYMADKDRSHLFKNDFRGSNMTMNLLHAGDVRGVERVAQFTSTDGATLEIYVDNRFYTDVDGTAKRYVEDSAVIGLDSTAFVGVQAFGAIKDHDGMQAVRMFHKEFRTDEPSVDYLLTQSAPLPIVLTPNKTFLLANVNA